MNDRDDEELPRSSKISVASERTLDNLSALVSPEQSPTYQGDMDRMDRNLGPDYRPGQSRPPHHYVGQEYDEAWSPSHSFYREEQSNVHRVQVSPDGDKKTSEFSFEYKDGTAIESPRHRQDIPRVFTGRRMQMIYSCRKIIDIRDVVNFLS